MKGPLGFVLGVAVGTIAGIFLADSEFGEHVKDAADDARRQVKQVMRTARKVADQGLEMAQHAVEVGRSVIH
ncbi:MAG: hypothetical protein C5B58_01645 [Acidobacteria bacterium]|nr:MAG: hypothetical protein C5B58_01645 [Acidobacteriota bacterium]